MGSDKRLKVVPTKFCILFRATSKVSLGFGWFEVDGGLLIASEFVFVEFDGPASPSSESSCTEQTEELLDVESSESIK
jgi:hypothetical protein